MKSITAEFGIAKASISKWCKENRLEAYRFIEQHHGEFGIRWLLRKLSVYPNVYYNFLKHRKTDYYVLSSKLNAASSVTLKQVFYSA